MKKILFAAAVICFFPALLLSQENPLELAEKVNKAAAPTVPGTLLDLTGSC